MKKYYVIQKLIEPIGNFQKGELVNYIGQDMCIVESEEVAKDYCNFHDGLTYREVTIEEQKE